MKNCSRPKKSSSGFSLIEVLVAAGLLGVMGVLAFSSYIKIFDLQRTADRRVDTEEMRAVILSTLSSSSNCATLLTAHGGGPVQLTTTDLDVGGVFTSLGASTLANNVIYDLQLQIPAGTPPSFASGYGRTNATFRYLANLNLVSTIANSNQQAQSLAQIPISMEFDQTTSHLVSCTVQPDDTDEVLLNNAHTARECQAAGGATYPSRLGLLCRFPTTLLKAGQAPSCPGGWTSTGYVSTISRDYIYQTCGGTSSIWAGWHYFSNNATIEGTTVTDAKAGTTSSYNWETGLGATGGSVLLLGLAGLALGPIGLLAVSLGFIFAFTTCTVAPPYTFYAQAMSIGCY